MHISKQLLGGFKNFSSNEQNKKDKALFKIVFFFVCHVESIDQSMYWISFTRFFFFSFYLYGLCYYNRKETWGFTGLYLGWNK